MTVLAIDDDPVARLLVSRLFEALGCEVIAVEDGETGLEVSRHRRLSLILIDMSLPGMDGRETMRQLRREAGDDIVPIVALTGRPDEADTGAVSLGECDEYLLKPLRPQAAVDLYARYVGGNEKQ